MINIGFVKDVSSSTRSDAHSLFVDINIDSLFIKIEVEIRELIVSI